jgi:transposase-like protein
MRYPASEKLEIIRAVEASHLPVRRTLDKIGIPKTTFYAWLDRYAAGGLDALEDHRPRPRRVWNRIPDEIRDKVIERALDEPELSPREVAVAFTDRERSFVSEASVYRLLKARGLVTSPAFIVMKAADAFANPNTAINQLWQTDFTYLKVTGWGWFYLSTVLDDFSRYIVAWKLCTAMAARDVRQCCLHRAGHRGRCGSSPRPRSAAWWLAGCPGPSPPRSAVPACLAVPSCPSWGLR